VALFNRILIANRGEIAVRVIRACRELGIETVAVHSDVDADSLHVKLADESVCIGPASARESYLNVPAILSAAKITGADAIHPGYGFLAENDRFAELIEQIGLAWIGPSPSSIRAMGNKVQARNRMQAAGVPIVPGLTIQGDEKIQTLPEGMGWPVLVKAAAGGGGKGMRLVHGPEEVEAALAKASAEAKAAFGSGEVYVERYLERARHVEIQVAADKHGRVIHLGERDCSAQRRHQKLIEEAPSPALTPELRARMGAAAVAAAAAVQYSTVGTVEFMLIPSGEFFFLEMNTRIQVEHPVTELVTNVDLVKTQIRLAAGEPLEIDPAGILMNGHAIECRINAEDHTKNFAPQGGVITALHIPGGPGIRVDTHIYEGYRVPTHYDSLLMKIIAKGADRQEAIIRMRRALGELRIEGVPTTTPFHLKFLQDDGFVSGEIDTGYVERWLRSTR
jgi:acetyl-CoA carboxylase biotin carboxylase subunit